MNTDSDVQLWTRSRSMFRKGMRNSHGNDKYKYINVFRPLPWQIDPWKDTSPILLLTGSAGGGKSVLAAEKIHGFMLKYPHSTGIILRKVADTLENSVVAMVDRTVIGSDPRVRHVKSKSRFEYNNGSILSYGGMRDDKQREHIRSIGQRGGLDIAWLEEATQFDEEDFNEVLARMRGNAAPWRQVILTTNPEGPAHWINVRLILGGEASVYYSKAADNKYNPEDYIKWLKGLTGVQYERLVLGKWVVGTGVVYDTWLDEFNAKTGKDGGGNVTLDADFMPGFGEAIWTIDDGYAGSIDRKTGMFKQGSHPRVILMAQLRSDGQIAIFNESYKVKMQASHHLALAKEMSKENGWKLPHRMVRDRAAASLGGAISDAGYEDIFSAMTVEESIKEMRSYVTPDENGWRRLIVHPRCKHFRYEMLSYGYDKAGRVIKEFDHGPDAARYLVWNDSYGLDPGIDIATVDSGVIYSPREASYA